MEVITIMIPADFIHSGFLHNNTEKCQHEWTSICQ